MNYKLDKSILAELTEKNIVSSSQAEAIWSYLDKKYEGSASFKGLHVTYYFGAMICILAMTWFMNRAWEQFGGAGLTCISIAYMVTFNLAGLSLWKDAKFKLPGGLLLTVAVCITPLLVYGIQRWTGYWIGGAPDYYQQYHQWIKGSWILMSLATVVVGGLYLRKIPFPFLAMPIAVALFYISMDMLPLIYGGTALEQWEMRKVYSVIFGAIMIFFSYLLDRRKSVDYSFWLYLFGLMAFWGGLTSMDSDSEIGKFIYCLINFFLIFLSLFLRRKAFLVFGCLGVLFYLGHLADRIFKDSLLFPVALAVFGLGIMYLGVLYQRNQKELDRKFTAWMPQWLLALRPKVE